MSDGGKWGRRGGLSQQGCEQVLKGVACVGRGFFICLDGAGGPLEEVAGEVVGCLAGGEGSGGPGGKAAADSGTGGRA